VFLLTFENEHSAVSRSTLGRGGTEFDGENVGCVRVAPRIYEPEQGFKEAPALPRPVNLQSRLGTVSRAWKIEGLNALR
jgi:hypothetical protein